MRTNTFIKLSEAFWKNGTFSSTSLMKLGSTRYVFVTYLNRAQYPFSYSMASQQIFLVHRDLQLYKLFILLEHPDPFVCSKDIHNSQ